MNMNEVDGHRKGDSLLKELQAPKPFVFHNVIFFWDYTF